MSTACVIINIEMVEPNFPEYEMIPIPYHLADDPGHMQLLEVCKKDIEVLVAKMEFENPQSRLYSILVQAETWFRTNSVTDLPDN